MSLPPPDDGRLRISSASPYADDIGFCAAVRAGDRVVVAGMTAAAADGSIVGDRDPYEQATEALRKAREALEAAGSSFDEVVRTRIFLRHREHWRDVGRAHGEALGHVRPAATMVVCDMLDSRMLVEIEVEAWSPRGTG